MTGQSTPEHQHDCTSQLYISMIVHQSSFINMASFEKRGQQVEFQLPHALEGEIQERIFGEASKDLQRFMSNQEGDPWDTYIEYQ